VAAGLQYGPAPREFTAFYAGPGRGRRFPHPEPGEASKLNLLVDQSLGQEPPERGSFELTLSVEA